MSTDTPLVLVVEDEHDLADLYATWLSDSFRVRVANSGQEALDELDDEVDVVLLDRRMPDYSGDEVLEIIRERGFDCRVAMVTAAAPDFDVLSMGFDDYVVKPVTRDDLDRTVSNLLLREEYDDGVQELFALASKKALLETEKSHTALEANDEYQRLATDLERLRENLDDTLFQLGEQDDLSTLYRDLGDE
ncbi:MAG: HalX domain-containing protein [Haloferacaceae archaeon]